MALPEGWSALDTEAKLIGAQDTILAALWQFVLDAKEFEGPPDTPNFWLRCELEEIYGEVKASFEAVPYDNDRALARIAEFLVRIPPSMKAAMRGRSAGP